MDFRTLCKRIGVRANMTNGAMAEALQCLEPLDLVDGISYKMAPIPIVVPAPTVTTRLAAKRSLSRKTEVVVSSPVPAILRRSQRRGMRKTLDEELKGEDISEVKERAVCKMPQVKLIYEPSEYDDDLDEDEERALNDDWSAEELSSTDDEDSGPDLEVLKELLNDLKDISFKKVQDTYNELKDKQII